MSAQPLDLGPIKATDCREIIGRYVPMKAHAKYSVGLCPFHDEKTPSFTVWSNGFWCFGCAAHGDAIDFVQRIENLSFVSAAVRLGAGKADLDEARRQAERRQIRALAEELRRRRERDGYQVVEDDYLGERRAAEASEVRYLQQRQRQGWISPGEWADRTPPARVDLVEGAFSPGNVALVNGTGGIGKTILLLQLCAAAALRRSWLGLSVRPGRSIFYACEDDYDELWRRLAAISRQMDETPDALGESMLLRSMVGQDGVLLRFKYYEPKPTPIWQELYEQAVDFGATYIVIDTASMTFEGNITSTPQVAAFINMLRRLAIATQGAVILTQHPSMTGISSGTGEAGTRAWSNSVRSRLYFYKDQSGKRVLSGVKSNYSLPLPPIPLRYDRGVFVRDDTPIPERWNE